MNQSSTALGAANLIRNKNDQVNHQYGRAERWREHAEGLQSELDNLSARFDALSSRNGRLEFLIKSMTGEGVASNALGTIHTLKAEALQKQADEEMWSVKKRREANLKLAAEAEYDYRLSADPSYRLNACADALMKIATYSDNADAIRKTVTQMYATGKVRKDSEKVRLIKERMIDMAASARYENDRATVPLQESLLPMNLEKLAEKKPEPVLMTSLDAVDPVWVQPNKIRPRV